jgi:hypothetical protein
MSAVPVGSIDTVIDHLARYRGEAGKLMIAFAAQSPRLADLARTHPVLFVGLASRYGDGIRRVAAIKAALDGRRLRAVSDLAGIPFSLRVVPIELCPIPLPPARWSACASPALSRFMPREPMMLSNWMHGVFFVNGAAGEKFALGLAARHELFRGTFLDHRRLLPLALLSWFAECPEQELSSLIPQHWSMRSGSRRLLAVTRAWLYRICCRIYLPGAHGDQLHSEQHAIGSYQAVELRDFRALLAEQQLMDNCLDRYGRRIAWGAHALFSLRTQTGVRIANFEVAIHAPSGPLVTEIRGRSNTRVSSDIEHAVRQWVNASSHILRRPVVEQLALARDPDETFAALIEPYVQTHKEALASCGPITLHSLERDLSELAARLGIKSWPVRFERTARSPAGDCRASDATPNERDSR